MLLNIVVFPLFFFLLPTASCTAAPGPAPAPVPAPAPAPVSPHEMAIEFIQTRCRATRYPDLCFTSLSRYADAVGENPIQLACAAATIAVSRLRTLQAHVVFLLGRTSGRGTAPLTDCNEQLGDAADQVIRSVKELRGLESEDRTSMVAWRLSNARTWMSAAITYEDTCSKGFQDVGDDDGLEADVRGWVDKAVEYTSNALALVNALGRGRR